MKRFWDKVKKTKNCWEWTAYLDAAGYGTFWVGKTNTYAHRMSWRINFGEIPKHLHVLHICDNRKCVKPTHLFLGTDYINSLDMRFKGRQVTGERLAKPKRKLTSKRVTKILKLWKTGKYFQWQIAEMFSVKQVTVSDIIVGRTWSCFTKIKHQKTPIETVTTASELKYR